MTYLATAPPLIQCASVRPRLVDSAMRRALLSLVLVSGAGCGGPSSKVPTTNAPVDGGVEAAVIPSHLVSTLPTDVRNPPPFNLGSKHVKRKEHPEWNACHVAFHATTDPAKAVDALATGCASVTQLRAVGSPMSGTQNAVSSQPITYKLHGQANHCYRIYGIAGSSVKSLVAVVADSDGAEIAEYHTDDLSPVIAPDEALCFSDDNDTQITVSVGIGDGPYVLSVWGN